MNMVSVKFGGAQGGWGGHKISNSLGHEFPVISIKISRKVFSSVWPALN